MRISGKLSSALGRRDELPNQKLAEQIVNNNDKKAVAELIENLLNTKSKLQSNSIKVIYEIGERKPELIN